jgi:glyoxylase-like metal-dependent hydrolase (beta-lactamase superfamily II)
MKQFPEVKIYTNAAGVEAMKDPRLNISHYHSDYPDISIYAPENVCIIKEGDELNILGETVKVYETPGHALSCITYIIEGNAFTGDAYIPRVKVFTGFPQSNRKQAAESVERILQLTSQYLILPGHTVPEGMTTMDY